MQSRSPPHMESNPQTLDNEDRPSGIWMDPGSQPDIRPIDERNSSRIRVVVISLLILALVYVIVDSLNHRHIESAILDFLRWVELHPGKGVVAVIGVYILATILFVPGSILTFGTAYAFGSAYHNKVHGVIVASMTVFIGASLGSLSTFLLGRYLFRSCVVRLASSYPVFQAVDRALQSNGLKIMILLRLSPLIPYNALDYMSGITAIPLWSYTVALLGLLPGTVSLCIVGASASSLTDTSSAENMTLKIVTIVLGVVFAAGGIFLVSYYSQRELERILADDNTSRELLAVQDDDDDEHTTGDINMVEDYRDATEPTRSIDN